MIPIFVWLIFTFPVDLCAQQFYIYWQGNPLPAMRDPSGYGKTGSDLSTTSQLLILLFLGFGQCANPTKPINNGEIMLLLETRNDSIHAFERFIKALTVYGYPLLSLDELLDAAEWLNFFQLKPYLRHLVNQPQCDWHTILISDFAYSAGADHWFDSDSPSKSRAIALSAVLSAIDSSRLYPTRIRADQDGVSFYTDNKLTYQIKRISFQDAPADRALRVSSALKGLGHHSYPVATKQLSKIPGLESIRFQESNGINIPILASLSTIVTLLIVGLSEVGVLIQRGHAQECLAAFLNVTSWNHLIAKERTMGVILPVPLLRRVPSKNNEESRDEISFYRNIPEAFAALSCIVQESNPDLIISGSDYGGQICANAYIPSVASPSDPPNREADFYMDEKARNSVPGWRVSYLDEVEAETPYAKTANSLLALDGKELESTILKVFGHTKDERLKGTNQRREAVSLNLGPWRFSRLKDISRHLGWFEIIDKDGRQAQFYRNKGVFYIPTDGYKAELMLDEDGNCVLVQEHNNPDFVLLGLNLDDVSRLADFFNISFCPAPPYDAVIDGSPGPRGSLRWPIMPAT